MVTLTTEQKRVELLPLISGVVSTLSIAQKFDDDELINLMYDDLKSLSEKSVLMIFKHLDSDLIGEITEGMDLAKSMISDIHQEASE